MRWLSGRCFITDSRYSWPPSQTRVQCHSFSGWLDSPRLPFNSSLRWRDLPTRYFNSIVYIQTSSLLRINLYSPLIDKINSNRVKCYLCVGGKCWKWTITQMSVWLMGQTGSNLSLNFTIVTLLFLLSLFCFYNSALYSDLWRRANDTKFGKMSKN